LYRSRFSGSGGGGGTVEIGQYKYDIIPYKSVAISIERGWCRGEAVVKGLPTMLLSLSKTTGLRLPELSRVVFLHEPTIEWCLYSGVGKSRARPIYGNYGSPPYKPVFLAHFVRAAKVGRTPRIGNKPRDFVLPRHTYP